MLEDLIFKKDKFPFIMVTATFANPLQRHYNKWKEETNLVQWSYEYIQSMKDISNDDTYNLLLNKISDEHDGDVKHKIITDLISIYNKKGINRDNLQLDYIKYPDLVVLSPSLEHSNEQELSIYNDEAFPSFINTKEIQIRELLTLSGSKTSKNFKYNNSISKFIDYIIKEVYEKLLHDRFSYNIFEKQHSQLWFLPTNLEIQTDQENVTDEDTDKGFIEPLTRLLTFKLLENPLIRKHFCILIIHGQKKDLDKKKMKHNEQDIIIKDTTTTSTKTFNDLDTTLELYEDNSKHTPICLSTKCIKGGDIKKCIEEQQTCSYAKNKSLIILTGARLRLGISLPCVDIALHMDPIHSVDTIYQSMFRVLTERPGKKRGFFIDLLKERLIKFIYKYDNYTNKSLKKPINIDSQLIRFKSQLFSWNVNAINNYERSEQEYSSIYDKLITSFNLDDKNKFIENIEKYQHDTNIEKILYSIPKITNSIYQNLKNIGLDFSSKDTSRKSIIKKLLERAHEPAPGEEVGKEENEGKKVEDEDEEEEVEEKKEEKLKKKEQNKRNKIVMDYIKNIFSLYALLIDDKEYCDIDNIKDLKKLLIKKITVTDLKNLCDFSKDTEVNYSLLDCYISFLKQFETKFDAKELLLIKDSGKTEEDMKLEILQIYKTQIIILVDNLEDNFEKTNDMLKLYCYYKDKLNMIKKNISTQGNIISSRCGVSNNNNNNMKGGAKEFIKETEINETVLETIRKYFSK